MRARAGGDLHGHVIPGVYKRRMTLYKPGRQFLWRGRVVGVDYVLIRRGGLWVWLRGHSQACRPEDLVPLAPS